MASLKLDVNMTDNFEKEAAKNVLLPMRNSNVSFWI